MTTAGGRHEETAGGRHEETAGGRHDGAAAEPGATPRDEGGPSSLRSELLLALELLALCALTFARPVLGTFGDSPDTFVARGESEPADLVLFALAVTLLPGLVLAALGLGSRLVAGGRRARVHVALVAAMGGVLVGRVVAEATDWSAVPIVAAGVAGVAAFGLARARLPSTATLLRYAGVASLVFVGQFLFASPAATLVSGGHPGTDERATAHVVDALGEDVPPIVFLVLDTFPTNLVLDGHGRIDAELYPNIAELASGGTWFRNNTTVSAFTNEAVPALLSGQYPDPGERQRFVVPYPHNLFTLFGGTHDLSVREPVTRLCPDELCPETSSMGLPSLFHDAVDVWTGQVEQGGGGSGTLPGLFKPDRFEDLRGWIDAQDFAPGGRPGLHFYHAMLPHEPFDFLPDGSVYAGVREPMTGIFGAGWTDAGIEVGRQRMVLQAQATDMLLGQLFDRMREAGTYDDTMIVVAADHGLSFEPGVQWRGVSEEQFDEIMWSLLITKAPGQTEGVVDDHNVETVDVLPMVADAMGFELPWEVDGLPLADNDERDPSVKYLDDVDANRLRAPDGEDHVEVDADEGLARVLATDPVEGTGPDAVWRRTAYGDLFGRAVADLEVGPATDASIAIDDLDRFEDIDTDQPLPLEVIGTAAGLDAGVHVAYAVDGTLVGLTRTEPFTDDAHPLAHALLPPDSLHDGANEITAYLVEGPGDDPALRPIAVEGG